MKRPAAKKPAAAVLKATKKGDDKKKAHDKSKHEDKKTDDDQNKTEASVQASQWDVPAQRPSWALVCDDNARPGVVEVSQLEEDKWISCRHIDLNSSVAGMSAHHYFFPAIHVSLLVELRLLLVHALTKACFKL